jgi:hypothetical protein
MELETRRAEEESKIKYFNYILRLSIIAFDKDIFGHYGDFL